MHIRKQHLIVATYLSLAAAANGATNWIDGVGDWFTPANWSAGVPTSGNRGQIGNGGTAQIAADAGNADVSVGVNFVPGNLVVSGSGRLNGSVDVGFSGNGTLMIADGGMVTNSANPVIGLTGPGVATVTGAGSAWTHTGNCRIGDWDLGTLRILAGGKVVTGSVSIGGTSIGGSATIDGTDSTLNCSGSITVGQEEPGSVAITKGGKLVSNGGSLAGTSGAGTVTVDGAGSSWVNSGGLTVGYSGSSRSGTLLITNGGTVSNANSTLTGSSPGAIGTLEVRGAGSSWTNNGTITVQPAGTLRVTDGGSIYANSTTITGGTLEFGRNAQLTGGVSINSGTIRALATTSFSPNISIVSPPIVDTNGYDLTLSGVVSGNTGGILAKNGQGTLRMPVVNTYTATTNINGGRLFANAPNGSSLGSGSVNVNTAVLGGTGIIGGPVTIQNGGVLLAGDAATPNFSLTIQNNLTLNSGATIQLVLGDSGAHSTLQRGGGAWSFAPNQGFAFVSVGAQPGFYDNVITGLTSNPGVSSWTITSNAFSGFFTYDGAGNVDLTLTAVPPALQLTSAVSRKTHSSAGTFDVSLPLTGTPGIECRSGNYSIVLTFTNPVVGGSAMIASGSASPASAATFSGNTMKVNLTGVANAQIVTLLLEGVTDSFSQVLPDTAIQVSFLVGDINGDSAVNSADATIARNRSGQMTDATNFRGDVNADGTINSADATVVRNNSGAGIPQGGPNEIKARSR